MLQQLAKNPFEQNTYQLEKRYKLLLDIIKRYSANNKVSILDIDKSNPFTKKLKAQYKEVCNIKGDIDMSIEPDDGYIQKMNQRRFDIILLSHIIEHIFNPLKVLIEIKDLMHDDSIVIIALPQRPKFLWTDHHFHEIDDYRIRLLFERANYKVLEKVTYKPRRRWWFYLSGIKPFLRLFLEKNSIYIITNKGE